MQKQFAGFLFVLIGLERTSIMLYLDTVRFEVYSAFFLLYKTSHSCVCILLFTFLSFPSVPWSDCLPGFVFRTVA